MQMRSLPTPRMHRSRRSCPWSKGCERLSRRRTARSQGAPRSTIAPTPQRKNQGLFELAKLQSLIAAVCSRPAVAAAFADLTVKLDLNRRLLGAQLRAAQTVADIVARAIRDHQSDGTYSAYPWRDDGR